MVEYEPLAAYQEWYSELLQCVQVAAPPLENVRWRHLPGATKIVYADTAFAAYWLPPAEIVVAGWYVTSERIVKHEMMHYVLRRDPEHRDPRWRRCGLLGGQADD